MTNMLSNTYDTRQRACRAMLTMFDGEYIEQRPTSISIYNVPISETSCSNLFVAKLSDLRIVKPRPTSPILLTPYSLPCDEHSPRPVSLGRRCLPEP